MKNTYTEQMENALFQQWDAFDNYNENYTELIDALNCEDLFRSFGDGLLFFLLKRNPELTVKSAVKYIDELCVKTSVSIGDIASANTLKSWFKGGPRPKTSLIFWRKHVNSDIVLKSSDSKANT